MGKMVIKFQGKVISESDLKLGDTKIGRKPTCDIVLDDPAVSGEHAVVKTVGVKSTIQDLGSKNGTYIENQRVKQHELRNGETIIIGGYALTYRDVVNLDAPVFGQRAAAPVASSTAHARTTEILEPFGHLFAVEGKDKGKRFPLVKDVLTLENPGKNPARITRTSNGYLIEASIGAGEPRLNDKPVPPGGHLLEDGDMVEVAGTKFQFFK